MMQKTALLCLLLFAGAASGAPFGLDKLFSSPSAYSCNVSQNQSDWFALSITAIALGLAITAGAWALSGVLGTQKYWDFLKGNLWGMIEAAFILGILLAGTTLADINNYGVGYIDTARTYTVIIRNTAMLDFSTVVAGSLAASFFGNVSPTLRPFGEKLGLYFTFQVAPMFRPIFDLLGILIQLLTVAVLEWYAHEFILCFIKNNMLTLFVPVGIFLRIFGLRGGGNALIGIAVALYFVYPYMIVQAGEIITEHYLNELDAFSAPHIWGCLADKPICCVPSAVPADLSEPFIPNGPEWSSNIDHRVSQEAVLEGPISLSLDGPPSVSMGASCVYTALPARVISGITSLFPASDELWSLVLGSGGIALATSIALIMKFMNLSWISAYVMVSMVNLVIVFLYETTFIVFIVSIVLPIFTIFITLTFAKEVTKALGTEIDLSALEKLI